MKEVNHLTKQTATVFDEAAHKAKGEALALAVVKAEEALAAATEHSEELHSSDDYDLEILEAELDDILDAEEYRKAKVDLDTKAEFLASAGRRVTRAERVLKNARKALGGYTEKAELAVALRPMISKLTRNHPDFEFYPLPGEPVWENIPAPAIVLVQDGPVSWNYTGSLSTPLGSGQGLLFAYVRDRDLHREITIEDLISAADGIAGLGNGVRAQFKNEHDFHRNDRVLDNGNTVSSMRLPIGAVYPEIPTLAQVEPDTLPAALEGLNKNLAFAEGRTTHHESVKGGVRTITWSASCAVLDTTGKPITGAIESLASRVLGQPVAHVGRITKATGHGGILQLTIVSKVG